MKRKLGLIIGMGTDCKSALSGGGVFVWKGKAASQKLSNNLNISNPHLSG
jgi:hypothetical protein